MRYGRCLVTWGAGRSHLFYRWEQGYSLMIEVYNLDFYGWERVMSDTGSLVIEGNGDNMWFVPAGCDDNFNDGFNDEWGQDKWWPPGGAPNATADALVDEQLRVDVMVVNNKTRQMALWYSTQVTVEVNPDGPDGSILGLFNPIDDVPHSIHGHSDLKFTYGEWRYILLLLQYSAQSRTPNPTYLCNDPI